MARDSGGAAVVLEAVPFFMNGRGQAECPGGSRLAGTCRPGSERTRGRSIRADASRTVPEPIVHPIAHPTRWTSAGRAGPLQARPFARSLSLDHRVSRPVAV